jgi:peptidoglycan biosynthesis protein MviN/MurJ (putative lipid II flippase)
MGSGQFILSLALPLDQYTAAYLGDAAIAILGYANRVLGLLLAVGAIAISQSALPVLSELAVSEPKRAAYVAARWAGGLLVTGIVAVVVGWIAAPWLIPLLFERGAFTSDDSQAVTRAFQWGLIQMPFFFSGLLLVQLLASQGRYRTIALIAAGTFTVKACANFGLALWLGVAGITLATGLMYAFALGALVVALKVQSS